MKKIIFCCYGGGHVQVLLPIIKKLQRTCRYEIKVFALTTAKEVFKENNIDCFSYHDLPITHRSDIQELGKQLASSIETHKICPEETIAYLGANMQDLIDQLGAEEAFDLYHKHGRHCFYPLELATKILQEEKPDLVIATNSPRTEKAMIQASSNLNIPAMCIVDSFALHEAKWIACPNFGKYVCVISNSVVETLVKRGRPPQDVYVTGNPAFDIYTNDCPLNEQEDMKRKIGVKKGQKVILYAPSPEGTEHIFTKQPTDPQLPEYVLNKLFTMVQDGMDAFLLVRPHPSQKFQMGTEHPNIYYDESGDLKLTLSVSDLVVTLASTVGIQAQLMGKPLICCNQSVYANDVIYEDFGPVTRVQSLDELESKVLQMLEEQRTFHQADKNSLSATDQITNLIDNVLA